MKTILVEGREVTLGNIFCIGRNYAEHVKELKNAKPTEPVVFMKPTSAIIQAGEDIRLPDYSHDVHHECELIIYIDKTKGLPWTKAKGFPSAACVSHFISPKLIDDINVQQFCLKVNGELRQQGNTKDMMFTCAEIISYLSKVYGLQAGDIIYTGTPAGVAALQSGDELELSWAGKIDVKFNVA